MFSLLIETWTLLGSETFVIVEEGARWTLAAGVTLRVAVTRHYTVQGLAGSHTLRRTVVVNHISRTTTSCKDHVAFS